jgi:hypothetical protein
LKAFEKKGNTRFLNNWMKNQIKEANLRNKTIKWKRHKNNSGSTKNNTKIYKVK